MSREDPFATLPMQDEWKGKTNPSARRKIQNRLNQRAYRERQRAMSRSEQSTSTSDQSSAVVSPSTAAHTASPGSVPTTPLHGTSIGRSGELTDPSSPSDVYQSRGPERSAEPQPSPLDCELAVVIRENVMQAAADNAHILGLEADLYAGQHRTLELHQQAQAVPPSLRPVKLQHTVAHDPIIDCLPEWRLRYRILKAISQGTLDQTTFCAEIRSSGMPIPYFGDSERYGFVVWAAPHLPESWEMSRSFVTRWSRLLQDCDEFLAVTNRYRTARGEEELSLPDSSVVSPMSERSEFTERLNDV